MTSFGRRHWLLGHPVPAQELEVIERTVYVPNQPDHSVSVVDGRDCNARDTSGCGQTPPTVAVGQAPLSIAIDDATHTVYVANQNDNTVSVINAATSNGHDSSGCAAPAEP